MFWLVVIIILKCRQMGCTRGVKNQNMKNHLKFRCKQLFHRFSIVLYCHIPARAPKIVQIGWIRHSWAGWPRGKMLEATRIGCFVFGILWMKNLSDLKNVF